MERDKQIKLAIVGVVGLVAVAAIAINLFGGGNRPKHVDTPQTQTQKQPLSRGASPRPER